MTNSFCVIDRVAWFMFLVWSAVGAIVMPWNPGPDEITALMRDPEAASATLAFLKTADAIWILLAAIATYFWAIKHDGLATARLQALIIILGSGAIEWIGHSTGWPFGPYKYTGNFGPRLGDVLPLAIPLAWLVIVVNTSYLLRFTPLNKSRLLLALAAAAVATIIDANLEPVAWHIKQYWIWYPAEPAPPQFPPWQNYLSWFVVAASLTFALPGLRTRPPDNTWRRPLVILAVINGLLGITHAAHLLRGG